MDEVVKQLINAIKEGAKSASPIVDQAVKQYVISNYVQAAIFGVLAVLVVIVGIHVIRLLVDYGKKYELVKGSLNANVYYIAIVPVVIASVLTIAVSIKIGTTDLYHAMNPFVSLIKEIRGWKSCLYMYCTTMNTMECI